MGQLYDLCQRIDEIIKDRGDEVFHVRGAIALKTGFIISLITPDDPDDPAKIADLRAAAQEVLGISNL